MQFLVARKRWSRKISRSNNPLERPLGEEIADVILLIRHVSLLDLLADKFFNQ